MEVVWRFCGGCLELVWRLCGGLWRLRAGFSFLAESDLLPKTASSSIKTDREKRLQFFEWFHPLLYPTQGFLMAGSSQFWGLSFVLFFFVERKRTFSIICKEAPLLIELGLEVFAFFRSALEEFVSVRVCVSSCILCSFVSCLLFLVLCPIFCSNRESLNFLRDSCCDASFVDGIVSSNAMFSF